MTECPVCGRPATMTGDPIASYGCLECVQDETLRWRLERMATGMEEWRQERRAKALADYEAAVKASLKPGGEPPPDPEWFFTAETLRDCRAQIDAMTAKARTSGRQSRNLR